jgi:hypothetical protein
VPTVIGVRVAQAPRLWTGNLNSSLTGRNQMPVILWLLGVPLTVILLLMLFGVF